jgi:glycosyltransferase involved in cell wall biosynthesis
VAGEASMSLRVLHVLESLAPGGIERTFLNMLRACRRDDETIRHDVLAFQGGALEPGYREAANGLIVAPDRTSLDACLREPYDLVHVLFERCAYRLLPRLLAQATTPVLYGKGYDMGGMYRLNEGLTWQADESMLAACDGVTFTTGDLARGYALPPGRTTVLRKAADVRAFSALAPPDPDTPQRIVCVANLHPRKRLGDLVIALAGIRRELPTAELRFVGGGNDQEAQRLARLARDLDVTDAVSFAGVVQDVPAEIARARVVALPSSCEGVPTALLEAMAAARPIVATNVGHVASIVDDGVEGFLVDVGDQAALTERLLRVLRTPSLAAAMGGAARERAATHDVRQVAGEWLEALRRAATGEPKASSPLAVS